MLVIDNVGWGIAKGIVSHATQTDRGPVAPNTGTPGLFRWPSQTAATDSHTNETYKILKWKQKDEFKINHGTSVRGDL